MRKLTTIVVLAMLTLSIHAQGQGNRQQRFSPEKFEADFQEYITKEAKLTQQEVDAFFPIYKEMQEKQRKLFDRQRDLAKTKPADEEGCLKAIKEGDEVELELKRIQQAYHQKLLKKLSASKVYDILKAEQRYLRHVMRNWGRSGARGNGQWGGQWPGQWPGQGQGDRNGQRQGQWPNNWQGQQRN